MNESMKKFLEKVAQDPELLAKMSAVQNPDEAYRLASALQDGFTKEEFITTMKDLAAASGDLTNDDLKKFAGGVDTVDVSKSVAASVGTVVVAASAI